MTIFGILAARRRESVWTEKRGRTDFMATLTPTARFFRDPEMHELIRRLGNDGSGDLLILCLDVRRVVLAVHAKEFGGSLQGDADGASEKRVEGVDPEHLAFECHSEVAGD